MSEDKPTYELEPDDSGDAGKPTNPEPGASPKPPDRPPPPAPGKPEAESAIPKARPAAPRPKLDAPGLLDDFDEDADLESDPEVDEQLIAAGAKKRPPKVRTAESFAGDPDRWFVQPGFPGLRWSCALAGIAAVGALVSKAATAEQKALLSTLLLLHELILHTLTGVLACIIASRFSERGLNQPETAAARIGVAVGAFYLIFGLNISIPTRIDEFLLATCAYVGAIALCFRLPRRETGILACCHFGFWIFVQVGNELVKSVASPGTAGG